ncbi:uncharacterized protein LOC128883634 [Hylaeus volcanicus]|uniref:uncharacterized protein LOC128883634 n=1 Tax=Hylaeus volcanicus TaxID=313075 RepID=UPI0023B858DD|nr:uncharacterized protein LOC128883634 [Hylaeus volcanicus]
MSKENEPFNTPGHDVPSEPHSDALQQSSKLPLVVVVIGMAGSGKTTMIKALWKYFSQPRVLDDKDTEQDTITEIQPAFKTYILNLDPAVTSTPYPANIDICDTIKYKEVMKQYKLGPNGAIMTCLNLFATKFDQVHDVLSKRAPNLDIVLVDTPGQIEVFNWSASGSIILDTLALSYPTVILYVLDTARCQSPVTFMSNMMYSCGVMYKSKLPFIMAFNKIDVQPATQCLEWMRNYNSFASDVCKEDSYMATLSRTCALSMNEFYEGIQSVSLSAGTSLGLEKLEITLQKARNEYTNIYLPWLRDQRDVVRKRREKLAAESAKHFAQDRERDTKHKERQDGNDLVDKRVLRWKFSR